jgi:hypothetical protein
VIEKSQILTSRDILVSELKACGMKGDGRHKTCLCPFHEDKNDSCSIYQNKTGVWRFKCHACGIGGDIFNCRAKRTGKTIKEVMSDFGSDLPTNFTPSSSCSKTQFVKKPRTGYKTCREAASRLDFVLEKDGYKRKKAYFYIGSTGPVGVVVRYERPGEAKPEKTFRQITLHPDGLWRNDGVGIEKWPLYLFPQIMDAKNCGKEIVIAEGEKAAEALVKAGFNATTTCGGAGKANKTDLAPLAGASVVIWPDADEAGKKHAADLLARLAALTPPAVVRVLDVSGLPPKADAADFSTDEISSFLTLILSQRTSP